MDAAKQPVGITIKNEGQDSQRVLFGRINTGAAEGAEPEVIDQALIDPGQEIQTTLSPGQVIQVTHDIA